MIPDPTSEAQAALTDDEVVRRVRAGEPGLFELLMRRHNRRLYRAARAILRDDEEAEDVVQQAYVQAWAALGQFRGDAAVSTWLTRIAIHEALSRRRRRLRRSGWEDAMVKVEENRPAPASGNPERQAWSEELRHVLEAAIDRLPTPYRSVFVLREVEGLSTAEVAACLELSEDAVKTRLLRARRQLRRRLWQETGIAAPEVFSFHLNRCDRIVARVLEQVAGS
jgi:RNA polymerase sigma-70 factor (ECF subfamily)